MASGKKYFVLIIDEDPIREILRDILWDLGEDITIVEATSGKDGLKKIENQLFDLVVTGMETLHINGLDLIKMAKKLNKEEVPKHFVLMGGLEKNTTVNKHGGVSCLIQPFEPEVARDLFLALLLKPASKNKKSKKSMNVNFINPFIEATLDVLKITAGIEAEKDFAFVKDDDDALGEITGILPITGDTHSGSFAITFPEEVYLKIVSSMLGEEYSEINEENRDGIAEMCNQIYGNARVPLNEEGFGLGSAIPKVVEGLGHKVKHMAMGTVLAVYFKTEFGTFTIECIIKAN